MRNLRLIPKPNDAIHGFLPEELNAHFSNIYISPNKNPDDFLNIINKAAPGGFTCKEVTQNDIILAVSHFRSQARGDDGILHSIIAKALPTIAPFLIKLFNVSLAQGVFLAAWKKSRILALKKVVIPSSPSDFRRFNF